MPDYAPVASAYLRNAEDMKAARLMCRAWPGSCINALYVGPATGEDFWGWLTIHLGTFVHVKWTAIDRLAKPLAALLHHTPQARCLQQDYRRHRGHYDLVVANYIFTHGPNDDVAALARFGASLLFCRDHGLEVQALRALFPGYVLYRLPDNTDRYQPHTLARLQIVLPCEAVT